MPERPNIILINCDDLGFGDLGCYGSQANETPALDRMAAQGLRLTDFYMASPVCSPSRAAMLTGCYPPRIGFGSFEGRWVLFPGQPVGLDPNEVTLARSLKQVGYATKIVGKWHCGDQREFLPTRHGFDEYYGLPYSNDMGRQAGAPEAYPPLPLLRGDEVIQEQPDQTSLTERYVEEAVRFLRANRGGPFFLYLAHMYVHLPLYVPRRFLESSRNGAYGAAVACIDWAAAVLLDELAQLCLDERTLMIFTSDNGSRVRGEGGSNGPLRGTKGTTWEGGQRVPCILRWPGRIPAGMVSSELVASLDIFPTLAALAGAPVPSDRIIDGLDARCLLFDGPQARSPRETFFYYMRNTLEAVRSGQWKLHVRRDGKPLRALYDLRSDPGETTDVADRNPETVSALEALAQECRTDLGDEATGIRGANVRPIGRVAQADTLTHYDPSHPYIMALYDIEARG